jgi:hypothetical protein
MFAVSIYLHNVFTGCFRDIYSTVNAFGRIWFILYTAVYVITINCMVDIKY